MYRRARLIAAVLLCLLVPSLQAAMLCARPGVDGEARPSGVINHWFPGPDGISLEKGAREIPLEPPRPGGGLAEGDRILLIQMQGAVVDSGNNRSYGDGDPSTPAAGWRRLDAGHFELLVVDRVDDDRIRVRGTGPGSGLEHHYENREPAAAGDPGRSRWQVVRVPQYRNATLTGDLRALPWDGRSGGILALDVRGTLDLAGHALDASASGFRGGAPLTLRGSLGDEGDYRYAAPASTDRQAQYGHHAAKGEGLAGTPRYVMAEGKLYDSRPGADRRGRSDGYPHGSMARGAPANAGGGGNSLSLDNSEGSGGGGGGGGRAGARGLDAAGEPHGGVGGAGLSASDIRLVPGGGGGAGTRARGQGLEAAGGPGGGVLLVTAGRIQGQGRMSVAGGAGEAAEQDAGGGGGGGGSLVLLAPFADMAGTELDLSGGDGGKAPAAGGAGGVGRVLVGGGMDLAADVNAAVWDRLAGADLPGASPGWRCQPAGTLISGVVFEDNGGSGSSGGKAHDGWQHSSESGVAGWPVRVLDEQGETVTATRTNSAGRYALKLPASRKGEDLRLAVELPDDWHVVAASDDPLPLAPMRHEGGGRWRFTVRPEVQYDALRLAVVRAPSLEEPRQRSISAGSTQLFPFRYQAHTPGRVRLRYRGNLEATDNWKHAFFLDPDCDGASEYVDHHLTRWVPVTAGEPVCVRVRVEVPKNAAVGALAISLSAETDIGDNPLSLDMPTRDTGIRITLE